MHKFIDSFGRNHLVVDKSEFNKFKFIGRYYYKLPLNSKRRKFCVKLSCYLLRLKFWWMKITGRQIVPAFEIASCPEIKLSEIKDRRFKIK